jgi:HEAT repeat protein
MMNEAARYDEAAAMKPATHEVAALLVALGDASWRVRKAAVQSTLNYLRDPLLIPALVAGLASEDNAGLRNSASEALVIIGAPAVSLLAQHLKTGDPDQRKFIVEVLGAIRTVEAQAALFEAQDDADVNVRAAASESLGRIGGDAVVKRLRDRLQGAQGDLQQAVYLLDALATAGARVPLHELQWFAGNPSLARSLYPVLGNTADRRASQILMDAIAVAPEGNRNAAIVALAMLTRETGTGAEVAHALRGHTKARERLLGSLDADEDEVVASAITLLAADRDPSLAPRFLASAASRTIVETAMTATLDMGRSAVPTLLREIDRVGIESRVLFLEAIEYLADPEALKDLLELARGPESRTSEAALRAVGAFGDDAVVEPLMELARREDIEVRRQATFALIAVALRHPRDVARRVRAATDAGDIQAAWLSVLGAVGRNDDISVVEQSSRHRDPEVRAAAVEAAASYGARFPRDTLVFALADESPAVRACAARALGEHKSEEVVTALLAASTDTDAMVAASALRALGTVGGERATKRLLEAVGSGESPIAIAALQSLFVLAPLSLEEAIRVGVRHVDAEVVREAIDVTLRLPAATARPILLDALQHPSWNVRRAAAESLVNRALAAPLDVLSEALRSETEPLVRDELERLSRVSMRA